MLDHKRIVQKHLKLPLCVQFVLLLQYTYTGHIYYFRQYCIVTTCRHKPQTFSLVTKVLYLLCNIHIDVS